MMTDQQRNEKRQRHPTAQDEDAESDVGSCCAQGEEREGTWRLPQWI